MGIWGDDSKWYEKLFMYGVFYPTLYVIDFCGKAGTFVQNIFKKK